MGAHRTFSESWHRIAEQKISLRSTVHVRKQFFRGKKWYVLHDPFNNSFFRIRPEAHEFVVRLSSDRTVGQVWDACLEKNPDSTPGQEDVIQLLAQLYFANLLYHELPASSAKLFERYNRRRQREKRSRLMNVMFLRIPLFDPDTILKKSLPVIRKIITLPGAVVWFLTACIALKVVIDNFDAASSQAQAVLAPANLIFLYAGLVLTKVVHEFGHSIVCRRFGGEVHTMGLMLIVFTPLPYMDATSSWSLQSRWQRALVGASGMIFEIFTASLAVFVWANTGTGIIHSVAYNMMIVASVSTILFNANPLLRYDGYYVLSDLIDIPNLHTRSKSHLQYIAEYYLFGCRDATSPAQSPREAVWLTVFGLLSGIYRFVVYAAIILFVADKFFLAGALMAVVGVVNWVVVPLFRIGKYLAADDRLARTRSRAVTVSIGCIAALIMFLTICPFPSSFRAPGVLEAESFIRVVNNAPGYVHKVLVPSGTEVLEGTALMELMNHELSLEIKAVQARLNETLALQMQALDQKQADLAPLKNRLQSIKEKLNNLEEQRSALVVVARGSGTWVSPRSREIEGTWLKRGEEIGSIVNNALFRFSAVVSQEEASRLFDNRIRHAEVRLRGQGETSLEAHEYTFIPFQHETLPSAALGWYGGGEIPVLTGDESGLKTAEPFFQIYADLEQIPSVMYYHGRSGQIRFSLSAEPLVTQWGRKFQQLLQKRYQV